MKRQLFSIAALCLMSLGLIHCGDDESNFGDITKEQPDTHAEKAKIPEVKVEEPEAENNALAIHAKIKKVLKQWREGYEKEDIEMYLGTFQADRFRYVSDLGTDDVKNDDVEFDDIQTESESATSVFERFKDIEIELSDPKITLNPDRTRAEVKNHYEIQASSLPGRPLEGGFETWLAAGDNRFTFELKNREWRITEWISEASTLQEIVKARKNDHFPVPPPPKLATTWGHIKTAF